MPSLPLIARRTPSALEQLDALSNEMNIAFFSCVADLVARGRLGLEAQAKQHGSTTVLLHSLAVAYYAESMARTLGAVGHLPELRRGALLHDYFLYDWHDAHDPRNRHHALLHPRYACDNACEDFPDLTELEREIILRHMFPLTLVPPRHAEAWIVTTVDKWCASYETAKRKTDAYPRLRALIGTYLPELVF